MRRRAIVANAGDIFVSTLGRSRVFRIHSGGRRRCSHHTHEHCFQVEQWPVSRAADFSPLTVFRRASLACQLGAAHLLSCFVRPFGLFWHSSAFCVPCTRHCCHERRPFVRNCALFPIKSIFCDRFSFLHFTAHFRMRCFSFHLLT